MELPSRILGRTGLKVSSIGLGTVEIGRVYGLHSKNIPDENTAIALLKDAVDMGVTFFDTARSYGTSEERIAKSGIARNEDVIIATKCCEDLFSSTNIDDLLSKDAISKQICKEVDESLRVLNLDCIPLVQLHGGPRNYQSWHRTANIRKTQDAG